MNTLLIVWLLGAIVSFIAIVAHCASTEQPLTPRRLLLILAASIAWFLLWPQVAWENLKLGRGE